MFVVFEGIDCSGKTTQSKLFLENKQGWERISYPNYNNDSGKLIGNYLNNQIQLQTDDITNLFIANFREERYNVNQLLKSKNVICDRYFCSIIAYHVANYPKSEWDLEIKRINDKIFNDNICIIPDILIYFDIDIEYRNNILSSRSEDFRYDSDLSYQLKVKEVYERYLMNYTCIYDGAYSIKINELNTPEVVNLRLEGVIK